jgi:hypothetical protein
MWRAHAGQVASLSARSMIAHGVHAVGELVILLDDVEECFADAWERRVGGQFSDAIRLFAIMTSEFDGETGHSDTMIIRHR